MVDDVGAFDSVCVCVCSIDGCARIVSLTGSLAAVCCLIRLCQHTMPMANASHFHMYF